MDYWGHCWGSGASELKSTTITQVRKQLEDWWTQCLSFGPQIKFLFAKNAENNVASNDIFWTPYLCLASHSEVCLFHNHLLSKSFVFSPQNFSLLGSLLPGNHFLGCFVFTDDLFFAQISSFAFRWRTVERRAEECCIGDQLSLQRKEGVFLFQSFLCCLDFYEVLCEQLTCLYWGLALSRRPKSFWRHS